MKELTAAIVGVIAPAVAIAIPAVLWSPCNGGDLSIGYPHEVVGEVVKDPTTRYVRAGESGAEKVSITIGGIGRVPHTMAAAHSDDRLVIECLSTRCAQIEKGEVHRFACRGVGRWLEPSVVLCKHVREE